MFVAVVMLATAVAGTIAGPAPVADFAWAESRNFAVLSSTKKSEIGRLLINSRMR